MVFEAQRPLERSSRRGRRAPRSSSPSAASAPPSSTATETTLLRHPRRGHLLGGVLARRPGRGRRSCRRSPVAFVSSRRLTVAVSRAAFFAELQLGLVPTSRIGDAAVPRHRSPVTVEQGYTPVILSRMKTAVSIPDDVFDRAEQMARSWNVSRSELYADALRRMIWADEAITANLDEVYGGGEHGSDPAISAQGRRAVLRGAEVVTAAGEHVVRRGSVWWVDLGEPQGSAPGLQRPVVVISADVFNRSANPDGDGRGGHVQPRSGGGTRQRPASEASRGSPQGFRGERQSGRHDRSGPARGVRGFADEATARSGRGGAPARPRPLGRPSCPLRGSLALLCRPSIYVGRERS